MKILLVDNGSLEAAATLALRDLAQRLTERTGREVWPVSLLHADKVDARELNGIAAEVVEPFLHRAASQGEMDFVVLPLFFGPSRAITDYLPGVAEKLRQHFPALQLRIAPVLFQPEEDRLVAILAGQVREKLSPDFVRGESVRVALVDHGSPVAAVTAVRNALARQLADILGDSVAEVAACSMERRPGPEYDFNEPLLEKLLSREGWNTGPVIVAQLFLMPGRHAGPGGDIAAICDRAEVSSPALRTVRTAVLGLHPGLVDLLADRILQLVAG
ncbi:MAG: cobalamin biosynthesis protein CbiX [Cephaloticoccus sp.]|nr:cobalamin biosynthesis protein CbiX [Cephaloticoccus sp.]MCF7761385.1 cobalamin biosynthesis protein CbiX [Cephaloticoccus sp.]